MTLATTVILNHITPILNGAAVTVFPANSSLTVEIWRAPDNGSGAPNDGGSVVVAIVPPMPLSGGTYYDSLPSDGNTYYYKARHPAQPGWAVGLFCAYSGGISSSVAGGQQTGYTFEPYKPMRTFRGLPMSDGNFATTAVSKDGTQASRTVQIAGQKRTLSQMLTELVPNAEFDIWESTAIAHAWANDLTAGAVVSQESTSPFSGDYSLKYANPDNATNSGWHGISTNDLNKGAFCVPLRAGLTYRVKVASKTDRIAGGQEYRVFVSFNAAETLTQSQTFVYSAVSTWQVDTFVLNVPAAAEANSKFYVQFNRNGDATATNFWVDSLRVVEDTVSPGDLAAAAANAGGNFVQNGDAEQGVAYWRLTAGGSLDSTTTSPIAGTKSLIVNLTASVTFRIQQCDRSTDLSGGQNPTGGNPLYVPFNGGDEVFGSVTFNSSLLDIGTTWRFGVEEYTSTKTFIQRTYLGSTTEQNGTVTVSGGATLQATTRFVVVIIEIIVSVGGGGVANRIDTITLTRISPPKSRVKAILSAAQAIATGAGGALIGWNATDSFRTVTSMHDPTSVVTLNSQVLVPAISGGTGYVYAHAQIQFANSNLGIRGIQIIKNGATVMAEMKVTATNGDVTTISCSMLDSRPATGDFYTVNAIQTSGANLNVQNGLGASFFEVVCSY